jgi:UPF0755 protein
MARPIPRSAPAAASKKSGPSGSLIFVTVVLMLLAFGCGYGALTVQADLTQPVAQPGAPAQPFVVQQGDTTNTIATNLENQHLIRNALMFRLYLKIKGLSPTIEPGTYQISPSMKISQILAVFAAGPPQVHVTITIPEGLRVSQYPAAIMDSAVDEHGNHTTLPNFSATDFDNIAVAGQPFDGGAQYWYVTPWKSPAKAALEGYLFPSTYYVDPGATALDIIKEMLDTFGEQLCPGPSTAQKEWIYSETDCKAHQATIVMPTLPSGVSGSGQEMGVFDALHKYYKDSLPNALIVASIAQREARTPPNFALVSSVYYNRWQQPNNGQTNGLLQADPTSQYDLGTTAKAGADPWAPLATPPANLPTDPYNTYKTPGLPPSAISNPGQAALYGAIFVPTTNYLYFIFGCDNNNHYETTAAQQQADQAKYGDNQSNGSCPSH